MLSFMKKSLLYFCFFILFPLSVYPQKQWTLEECIVYASQNNLQLKQAENNARASRENLTMNKGAMLPTVNASSSYNYNLGRTIDPFTNQYSNNHITSNNYSLSGSLNIFNGLQTQNSIKQSQASYQASKLEVERLKNDLSLNVASAYLQILLNEEIFNDQKNSRSFCSRKSPGVFTFRSPGTIGFGRGTTDQRGKSAANFFAIVKPVYEYGDHA
jgi:outer membrane protein